MDADPAVTQRQRRGEGGFSCCCYCPCRNTMDTSEFGGGSSAPAAATAAVAGAAAAKNPPRHAPYAQAEARLQDDQAAPSQGREAGQGRGRRGEEGGEARQGEEQGRDSGPRGSEEKEFLLTPPPFFPGTESRSNEQSETLTTLFCLSLSLSLPFVASNNNRTLWTVKDAPTDEMK